MCVSSAIHDYYKDKTDYFYKMNPTLPGPSILPGWPITIAPSVDQEKLALLKELLAIAKRIDAKLGEPDCIDPEKAKWLENLMQDSI